MAGFSFGTPCLCLRSRAEFTLVTERRRLEVSFRRPKRGRECGDGGFARRAFPNHDGVNSRTCLEGCSRSTCPFLLPRSLRGERTSSSPSLPPLFIALFLDLPLPLDRTRLPNSFHPLQPPSTPCCSFECKPGDPAIQSPSSPAPNSRTTQSPCASPASNPSLPDPPPPALSTLYLPSLQHRLSYGDNMLISHSRC